jgi:general secretion pathway protein D
MKHLILALALLLLLGSCATVEPYRPAAQRTTVKGARAGDAEGIPAPGAERVGEGGVEGVEVYPGSGEFINEEAARRPVSVVSEDGEIVLNFEAESLQSVVHTILGEVLQETFVIGPGVGGEVTFSTAKPVSRDQLMPILELLLRWNGATLVYSEGRYHVLPVSDAIRGHLVPRLEDASEVHGYEVRAVPLTYISATEMAKILEPYVRENAIVNVDIFRSMIFLAGTAEELGNYLQTIEIFDVDWLAGMSVGIFPLRTVDVASITAELMGIFGAEAESPLAGLFRFVPLERLGSVLVITPREEYLETAREWIERLDRGAAGAGTQLFVYRVKNLEATVLASYLSQLFGGTAATQRGPSRGTLAPGLEPVTAGSVSDFNRNRQSANQRGLSGERQATGAGSSVIETDEGEIRITSVIETNSLLIQATQAQYASIQAAINRIDEEPLQVLIEAQVIDVALNDALQFGVSWFLSNRSDLLGVPEGTPVVGPEDFGSTFGSAILSGGDFLSTISRYGGGGRSFVEATIRALDEVSDVRTLAAPSLLVRPAGAGAVIHDRHHHCQRGEQRPVRVHRRDAHRHAADQSRRPGLPGHPAGRECAGRAERGHLHQRQSADQQQVHQQPGGRTIRADGVPGRADSADVQRLPERPAGHQPGADHRPPVRQQADRQRPQRDPGHDHADGHREFRRPRDHQRGPAGRVQENRADPVENATGLSKDEKHNAINR